LPAGFLADWRVGDHALGAAGLAAGTGVAAWVEWALLRRNLTARIGPVGPRMGVVARIAGACAAASVAGAGLAQVLPALHPILVGGLVCAAFGVVYLAVAAVLGLAETQAFARRLRGAYARVVG
jgi:putative peptidoglycan lipid II flippase